MTRTIANRHLATNASGEAVHELSATDLASVVAGTIGSATSGAGAGKVTFNPFSITRKID